MPYTQKAHGTINGMLYSVDPRTRGPRDRGAEDSRIFSCDMRYRNGTTSQNSQLYHCLDHEYASQLCTIGRHFQQIASSLGLFSSLFQF